MKAVTTLLAGAGLVAAHGYIDNGTIGGEFYEFYQVCMAIQASTGIDMVPIYH